MNLAGNQTASQLLLQVMAAPEASKQRSSSSTPEPCTTKAKLAEGKQADRHTAAAAAPSAQPAPASAKTDTPAGDKPLKTSVSAVPACAGTAEAAPVGSASTQAGCGAAAPSLSDPACIPGTAEFKAAKARNDELLEQYRVKYKALVAQGAAKPDMTSSRSMRATTHGGLYGHIPGVAVGSEFDGRGELCVLSLHTHSMKGINCSKEWPHGATAISMSGGYVDNDDRGNTFIYTGAGGRDAAGKQVADQRYDHKDNAAMLQNYMTQTPVRVFRARPGKPPVYVYEGLYQVIGHALEKSNDGPKVIRFTMQGVPGHSAVSGKVEFKCLSRSTAFQKIQLAGAEKQRPAERRKVPKDYRWDFSIPSKTAILRSIKERKKSGETGRLVMEDVAEGLERIPIPVWNAVDDVDSIFVPTNLRDLPYTPEDVEFEYMEDYDFTDADDALELAKKAEKAMRRTLNMTCGLQYHGGQCLYNEEKLLTYTQVCGVMECPEKCKGSGKGKNNLCKRNRVMSEGIRYPLEVFKVPNKGWGARCAVDLPAGAVLCPYIGVVVTDRTAEIQKGADTYLYDLNHFHLLEGVEKEAGERDPNRNSLMPLISQELKDHHLVVDASHEGNVARFINHSCDPNCVVQTVFARGARSHLLHYIVIVAAEDIPKNTELTYDYGMLYIEQGQGADGDAAAGPTGRAGKRIRCNCGSYNCKGWLKD